MPFYNLKGRATLTPSILAKALGLWHRGLDAVSNRRWDASIHLLAGDRAVWIANK